MPKSDKEATPPTSHSEQESEVASDFDPEASETSEEADSGSNFSGSASSPSESTPSEDSDAEYKRVTRSARKRGAPTRKKGTSPVRHRRRVSARAGSAKKSYQAFFGSEEEEESDENGSVDSGSQQGGSSAEEHASTDEDQPKNDEEQGEGSIKEDQAAETSPAPASKVIPAAPRAKKSKLAQMAVEIESASATSSSKTEKDPNSLQDASKLWNKFVGQDEEMKQDLDHENKDGYVEKMEFLQRTEQRRDDLRREHTGPGII